MHFRKTVFVKISTPLSTPFPKEGANRKFIWRVVIGSIFIVAGFINFIFSIIVFLILCIIGGFIIGWGIEEKKESLLQKGNCPYCGAVLTIKALQSGSKAFKCAVCQNVGTHTPTTLETTHKV